LAVVIKGNPRGGPAKLAVHLTRTDTNEKMRVDEIRGVAAKELDGALREMDALGAGLKTERTLYHASINTRGDERMTPEQRAAAIDRLEEKLGLTGQPRVVVEHTKKERDHIHIVWSRTDLEHMRAIRCDHNYRKHEEVARELEREFGHARVQGAHAERDGPNGDRVPRPERTPGHDEMQQAERSGMSPQQAKAWVTETWRATDSGKAFKSAIEEQGWTLARGDRRDFVLLDPAGNVHGLARRVEGANAADIRARMADIDRETLPGVAEVREARGVLPEISRPENSHATPQPQQERPADRPAFTTSTRDAAQEKEKAEQAAPVQTPQAGRAAGKVLGGISDVAGSALDWFASSFERLFGGDSAAPPQPEKTDGHAMPEQSETLKANTLKENTVKENAVPEPTLQEKTVRTSEEARSTRRQALMAEYGRALNPTEQAELEAGVRKRDDGGRSR
jgi:hypothetical protein